MVRVSRRVGKRAFLLGRLLVRVAYENPGVLRPSKRVLNSGVKSRRTEGAGKTRTPRNGDDAFAKISHRRNRRAAYQARLVARTGDATSNIPGRSFASAGRPRGTRRMAGKARNWNAATREANSNQPPTGSPAGYAREDSATAWVLNPRRAR